MYQEEVLRVQCSGAGTTAATAGSDGKGYCLSRKYLPLTSSSSVVVAGVAAIHASNTPAKLSFSRKDLAPLLSSPPSPSRLLLIPCTPSMSEDGTLLPDTWGPPVFPSGQQQYRHLFVCVERPGMENHQIFPSPQQPQQQHSGSGSGRGTPIPATTARLTTKENAKLSTRGAAKQYSPLDITDVLFVGCNTNDLLRLDLRFEAVFETPVTPGGRGGGGGDRSGGAVGAQQLVAPNTNVPLVFVAVWTDAESKSVDHWVDEIVAHFASSVTENKEPGDELKQHQHVRDGVETTTIVGADLPPLCPNDATCRFYFRPDHQRLFRHTCRSEQGLPEGQPCKWALDPQHRGAFIHHRRTSLAVQQDISLSSCSGGTCPAVGAKRTHTEAGLPSACSIGIRRGGTKGIHRSTGKAAVIDSSAADGPSSSDGFGYCSSSSDEEQVGDLRESNLRRDGGVSTKAQRTTAVTADDVVVVEKGSGEGGRGRTYDGGGAHLELGATKVSLRCPLSFTKMKHPARGLSCTHESCFDLYWYLHNGMNTNAGWSCPHCQQPVYPLTDLVLDSTLQEAIDVLSKQAEERRWEHQSQHPQGGRKGGGRDDDDSSDDDDDDDDAVIVYPNGEWKRCSEHIKEEAEKKAKEVPTHQTTAATAPPKQQPSQQQGKESAPFVLMVKKVAQPQPVAGVGGGGRAVTSGRDPAQQAPRTLGTAPLPSVPLFVPQRRNKCTGTGTHNDKEQIVVIDDDDDDDSM